MTKVGEGPMRRWRSIAIVAALGYASFLIWIVWRADTGRMAFWLQLINDWPGLDKLCHFLLVGGLALMVNWALGGRQIVLGGGGWGGGTVLVALLATVEEASQAFVPVRTCSWWDLGANYAGILLLGPLGVHLARRWWPGSEARKDRPPESWSVDP